jgi:hypothetical protein
MKKIETYDRKLRSGWVLGAALFCVMNSMNAKIVTIGPGQANGAGYLYFPTAQQTLNLVPGDTLRITAGTYQGLSLNELAGTAAAPITVTCDSGAKFTCTITINNEFSNVAFVNFSNFRYENYSGRIMWFKGACHDLRFENFNLINTADYSFYIYDANKVFNGTRDSAFYNFKWVNCVFDGKTGGGSIVGLSGAASNKISVMLDFEIDHCTFRNFDTSNPYSVVALDKCFNLKLHDSTFTDIGGAGAFAHVACLFGTGYFAVYNNTFTRVWGDEVRAMPLKLNSLGYNGADAVNRFYNNISSDKKKYAMFEVNDVNIPDSEITASNGLLSRTSTEIYFNTLYRTRKVDYVAPLVDLYASNITIKNNLVIEPEYDATFDPGHNYIANYGTGPLTNIVLTNNLTYGTWAQAGLMNDGSFLPSTTSPVLDAAVGGAVSYITVDRYGQPRYFAGTADVGAVESQNSSGSNHAPIFTNAPLTVSLPKNIGFNFTFTASGASSSTFTVGSGSLPPGLGLSGSGLLSGTPSQIGNFTGSIRATNSIGSTNQSFTISVTGAPIFTSDPLAVTIPLNTSFGFSFTASGNPAPTFTWSGTLPAGLSFNAGVLAGTPSQSGQFNGTVTASNSLGSVTQSYSLSVSTVGTIPGWISQAIGSATPNGNATFQSGSGIYTLPSQSNGDIWNTADSFQFLYQSQTLTGDGTIIAQVQSISNTSPNAKAGIMMRLGTGTSAPHATVCFSPGGNITNFLWRSIAQNSTANSPAGYGPNVWLKLVRSNGTTFTGYVSTNGSSWVSLGAQTIPALSGALQVGLIECSNNTTTGTATFSNVTVTPAAPTLTLANIGAASPGSASVNGGLYTLAGAANGDIWNQADSFQYYDKTLTGDGTIIARLDSTTNTNVWAKAGLMMRASTAANSAHAMMCYSPNGSSSFMYRSTPDGAMFSTSTNVGSTVWFKLERLGNVFKGYVSTTGATGSWVQVGAQQTITMPAQIVIGLVECSNNSTSASATFSNVVIP